MPQEVSVERYVLVTFIGNPLQCMFSRIFLDLSPGDWCWLVGAAAMVWTAEAMNTAVELLGDVACGGAPHPVVGRAKDVAAAEAAVGALR